MISAVAVVRLIGLIHKPVVLGLHGKGLVAGRAAGMASVRNCQKIPLCPMEPMPAGSKTDLPLGKAKPITNSGSASGITHLRSGGGTCSRREE